MKTSPQSLDRKPDKASSLLAKLPNGHILNTFTTEHKQILEFLDRLDSLRGQLTAVNSPDDQPELIDELSEVIQELLDAEPHRQREEKVLFPAMKKRGITDSPYMLSLEHDTLRYLSQKLVKVLTEFKGVDFEGYKARIRYFTRTTSRLLREHIQMENEVVFPRALEIIINDSDWEDLKKQCDRIGYCSFTHLKINK